MKQKKRLFFLMSTIVAILGITFCLYVPKASAAEVTPPAENSQSEQSVTIGEDSSSVVEESAIEPSVEVNSKLKSRIAVNYINLYRLYNRNNGGHFYTKSVTERDARIAAGLVYEGVAWKAPTNFGTGAYRLYNPNSGEHFYTIKPGEKDNTVNAGWRYEGIEFNAFPLSSTATPAPIYRLFNPNTPGNRPSHHYTKSAGEKNNLINAGWRYEGVVFYVK